jgi:hypothetical protein
MNYSIHTFLPLGHPIKAPSSSQYTPLTQGFSLVSTIWVGCADEQQYLFF